VVQFETDCTSGDFNYDGDVVSEYNLCTYSTWETYAFFPASINNYDSDLVCPCSPLGHAFCYYVEYYVEWWQQIFPFVWDRVANVPYCVGGIWIYDTSNPFSGETGCLIEDSCPHD
jgi:hypothetical protein